MPTTTFWIVSNQGRAPWIRGGRGGGKGADISIPDPFPSKPWVGGLVSSHRLLRSFHARRGTGIDENRGPTGYFQSGGVNVRTDQSAPKNIDSGRTQEVDFMLLAAE
jgi:hypothetical protein